MHSLAEVEPIATNSDTPLYLAFALAGQDYAVPIHQVREIREWSPATPLPNSPRHVKGVLNLRGAIVPVVDMRLRFGLDEKERDVFTVVIVVNVGARLAGLVVDSVSDVMPINADERCTMSEFEGQANRPFIAGLAQVGGRLLIELDVEKLLNPEELSVTPTGTGS